MFSRTNKTNFSLDLDYHNNNILYFPSDKHLYIYKQLYNKYTTKALKKYTTHFTQQFYKTIQTNTTKEYNKIFKSDYTTNKDYIKYSNAYDFKIKHAKSIEAFNEMLSVACNNLYETIRKNTKTLIVKCDAYLAKLFYIEKQLEVPTYNSIVDDLYTRFYTYNAPRNNRLLQSLCKNRCVNKLNKYKKLLKDFIKIVYVKVVVYNVAFKIAINKILRSSIYNNGLGLKLSIKSVNDLLSD